LGDRLEVALPLVIRRRRLRQIERTSVLERFRLQVHFYNPVTGHTISRNVSDISFGGICFVDDEAEDVVWEGLPLEHTVLNWQQRRVDLGELEVRSVERTPEGALLCHCMFRTPGAAENRDLVDLIATLRYPNLEIYDGEHFDETYCFYEKVGLISPHMKRNLSPQAPETWKRLFGKGRDIARALVHREHGKISAAISTVRAWERTWLIQHLGALPSNGSKRAGDLTVGILEHLIPRPDADYIFFFVLPASPTSSFYGRFIALTGTAEALVKSSVFFWTLPADGFRAPAPTHDVRIRPLIESDELLVSRAAERCLGVLMAKAISIQPAILRLPDTRKRFKQAALKRERTWRVITRHGVPVLAVFHEVASPGVNLTWKLNASWIIPIHTEFDRDGAATRLALADAAAVPTLTPTGDRFLFTTSLTDNALVTQTGFSLVYRANAYILNRAGLQRLYYYAKNRYGEVEMLTDAMNKRRNGRGSPSSHA
jgi:hypothetical protein